MMPNLKVEGEEDWCHVSIALVDFTRCWIERWNKWWQWEYRWLSERYWRERSWEENRRSPCLDRQCEGLRRSCASNANSRTDCADGKRRGVSTCEWCIARFSSTESNEWYPRNLNRTVQHLTVIRDRCCGRFVLSSRKIYLEEIEEPSEWSLVSTARYSPRVIEHPDWERCLSFHYPA